MALPGAGPLRQSLLRFCVIADHKEVCEAPKKRYGGSCDTSAGTLCGKPWDTAAGTAQALSGLRIRPSYTSHVGTMDRQKYSRYSMLCNIVLPGRNSAFRAGCWPDCYLEKTEVAFPAGLRPAGGPMSVLSRWQSGQNPAGRSDFKLGSTHYCVT